MKSNIKDAQKNSTIKSNLWAAFKHKQYAFDKALRQAERAYNRSLADDIESINSEDPKLFWEHIKKLGPAKKNTLPTSVKDGSNNLVDNIDDVLNVWRTDFENLYNLNDQGCTLFDDTFLSSTLAEKERLESLNCDSIEQIWYNNMFTVEEMDKVCNKLKEGKSTGPDMIPNTVLKHVGIKSLCLSFINVCFENHCVPSSWQQAIIAPIPKSASKDPYVPLNYRGISLLSCFYKMYSSLINNRVVKHCDINDLLVDEQNGFRKDRSCLDHIFSLSSVIKNRMCNNLPTFCAFKKSV